MEDIEKHIKNLKQYIKEDEIIENEIIENDNSNFAKFCKGHIEDIQAVLNELDNRIPKEEVEKYFKNTREKRRKEYLHKYYLEKLKPKRINKE